MRDDLTCKYKDHTIVYQESADKWHCQELELSAVTLSALKRQIDERERVGRKLNVEVYLLDEPYSWDARNKPPALVKVILGTITENGKDAWITNNKSRSKVDLSSLHPISEGTEKAFATWMERRREAKAADAAAKEAKHRMPALNVSALKKETKT